MMTNTRNNCCKAEKTQHEITSKYSYGTKIWEAISRSCTGNDDSSAYPSHPTWFIAFRDLVRHMYLSLKIPDKLTLAWQSVWVKHGTIVIRENDHDNGNIEGWATISYVCFVQTWRFNLNIAIFRGVPYFLPNNPNCIVKNKTQQLGFFISGWFLFVAPIWKSKGIVW